MIALLIVLVMLGGTGQSGPSFDELARQAGSAREAGQLARAAGLYERCLTLRPEWPDGWWHLGTVRYDLGEFRSAKDAFLKVAAAYPQVGSVWAYLGFTEYQLGSYAGALENLGRARKLGLAGNPDLIFLATFREATLLTRFSRYDEALGLFLELANDAPDNLKLAQAMGICVLRLPKLPSELEPGQEKAVELAGWASIHDWIGRRQEADQEYRELIRLYPSLANVHYAYGVFLLKSDGDAAIDEFRKELSRSPDHIASLLQISYELLKRGRPEEALPQIRHALELVPKSPSATAALGRAYLQMGKLEEARSTLEEAVVLAPDSAELHSVLTTLCFRLGRKEDARRHREIAERLRAEHDAGAPKQR
ncbi:MAG: tetratricopeptide repeat protein [Acidobacteriota bacterium]